MKLSRLRHSLSSVFRSNTKRILRTDLSRQLNFESLERRQLMAADFAVVKDIFAGVGTSSPASLTAVGAKVFFVANDGTNGNELWVSDGSLAGTTLVRNISAGGSDANPSGLTNLNGTLFFSATDTVAGTELWKSDGTSVGTVMVKDIASAAAVSSSPSSLANINGTLYFAADDGTSAGLELWKSDGTLGGTVLVRDIDTTANVGSDPRQFTLFSGSVFFTANTAANGRELWKSDGTNAGTVLVKDINSGANSSLPFELTAVGTSLYFQATDVAAGSELWKSDGTNAGTVIVKDTVLGTGSGYAFELAEMNGTLFFSAQNASNNLELWSSTGSAATTLMVSEINSSLTDGSGPAYLTNVNGTLFFSATNGTNGYELWRSDGTAIGTQLVKDINVQGGVSASSQPGGLKNIAGTLYFSANDGTNGYELWRSNGSAANTSLLTDITGNATDSNPRSLTLVNNKFFVIAESPTVGREVFVNNAPTISAIGAQTVASGAATASLPFTLFDAETPVSNLVVTATSSNLTLVPLANIVFSGTGANRSVVVTSVSGQSGTSDITLIVTDGALSTSTTFTLTVTAVAVAPKVESFVFGDGTIQRSMITSITVNFDSIVTLDPNAFLLESNTIDLADAFTPVAFTVGQPQSDVSGKTVVTLAFSGTGITGGSLPDGDFRVTALSSKIRSSVGSIALDTAGAAKGAVAADNFFRLFGDFNGSGNVNAVDTNAYKPTIGTDLATNPAAYKAYFDFNSSANINAVDTNAYKTRIGKARVF